MEGSDPIPIANEILQCACCVDWNFGMNSRYISYRADLLALSSYPTQRVVVSRELKVLLDPMQPERSVPQGNPLYCGVCSQCMAVLNTTDCNMRTNMCILEKKEEVSSVAYKSLSLILSMTIMYTNAAAHMKAQLLMLHNG